MKKVVLASLLAIATAMPFAFTTSARGQGVTMSADEYKMYNDATTATAPADKAAKFEAYLKAYPSSTVKADALTQLMFAYYQATEGAKTLDAADRLLAVDPQNLRALVFEVYFRRNAADQLTDPTARAAALDVVAGYAQKGLAATKPKDMADADWKGMQSTATPSFLSAIADDQLANKNNAAAIDTLKKELHAVPVADTQDPNKQLQDTWVLAQAYYTLKPAPDYVNCTWYASRALYYAPAGFKPTIKPVAEYCYKKYHGGMDGYDAVTTAVVTNLDPPSTLVIKPAPKPSDIVAQLIATTPDLSTLAISDREFALQYGTDTDPKTSKSYADEVFDAVKGKAVKLPDVVVVSAAASQITVAVSDDAVQGKTADYTFNFAEPLKEAEIPKVGDKITISGVYDSYTSNPIMITMTQSELEKKVVPKKPTPARRPVHK